MPVTRTLQSEINSNYVSYQFRAAPYSLSASVRPSVRRRILQQKCRYIGHLRRADEVDETSVPNPEHERRTPEEDKWLKEIVYQNGFDFYVLLHHRFETLAADPRRNTIHPLGPQNDVRLLINSYLTTPPLFLPVTTLPRIVRFSLRFSLRLSTHTPSPHPLTPW